MEDKLREELKADKVDYEKIRSDYVYNLKLLRHKSLTLFLEHFDLPEKQS